MIWSRARGSCRHCAIWSCRIAVDDFGTGCSSLNYLVRLPVDTIKIDQSFVALMTQSPETMGLVSNIINLGRSLSLQIVAEGVEEEEQMKLLRPVCYDVLQGYLMGRPLPESGVRPALHRFFRVGLAAGATTPWCRCR
ncbi:MAG: EAL domain-containing protein [Xanthomonadales bacterium]|nr:EAL domain-containing protein [Xanthomonadales bacterium]